jgi:outer membrane usher protein FimD/PapC
MTEKQGIREHVCALQEENQLDQPSSLRTKENSVRLYGAYASPGLANATFFGIIVRNTAVVAAAAAAVRRAVYHAAGIDLTAAVAVPRAASTQLFTIVRTAFTAQATSSSSRIAYPRFTEAGFYSADDWLSRLSSETSHLHRQPNYTVEILSTLRGRDQHHPRPATSRIYNYPTYSIEESGTGSTEVLF